MGNGTSRVVGGCFVPSGNGKEGVDLVEFQLGPLDDGLGHSFCYVRPAIPDSPAAATPSNSDRFTADSSSTFGSETYNGGGSFRQEELADGSSGAQRTSKDSSETTFRTISGASVSANASTARTGGNPNASFLGGSQEPAASFESTASFAAIPLHPAPHGSGPLNGFMSGPLERGFASGPSERGGSFSCHWLEKGPFMSGPLDSMDGSNFSASLAYGGQRRRSGFGHLVKGISRHVRSALSRAFARHQSSGCSWVRRFFLHPMSQIVVRRHNKGSSFRSEVSRNCEMVGPSENECGNKHNNLQWAHGKAGEDRVHVVLSEEQGWLFVGIYDGFSGPDAADFLVSNLYKAMDRELEGLLWDYEVKPGNSAPTSGFDEISESKRKLESTSTQEGTSVICEEGGGDMGPGDAGKSSGLTNEEIAPSNGMSRKERKSMRLYELLQMELMEEYGGKVSSPTPDKGGRRTDPQDFHLGMLEDLCSRECLHRDQPASSCAVNMTDDCCLHMGDLVNSREDEGAGGHESKERGQEVTSSYYTTEQEQKMGRSLIGTKMKKLYRKQKSLRKKLFPWRYDWHRDQAHVEEKVVGSPVVIRRCKPGPIDHDAVLKAMSHALETTEEAYMNMVEKTLDRNPELALMGSCVLVMLMKDQDVYVMNLGDSRVILAKDRPDDCHSFSNMAEEDARDWNRSRESLVHVELDRIEESPMHKPGNRICKFNKNRDISMYRLSTRAVQLSTDHSTDIKEEVLRIKVEHPDDAQAIFNDRLKGQLKVTRAFGAGFLKKPNFNEVLLEMFRIDYIGTSPYLSCIPSVVHHRLCSNSHFLVLSSDGLYQYFSNEEVVAHVAWFMQNVPEGDPAQYLITELLFRAAKKNGMDFQELLDIPHGDRRKYHDDVSVMVVSLEGRIWRSSG